MGLELVFTVCEWILLVVGKKNVGREVGKWWSTKWWQWWCSALVVYYKYPLASALISVGEDHTEI